jgi:hypothetical protein
VGVEGGDALPFRDAPYYDPAALHGSGRIIVAAFTTDAAPPTGKIQVARIHLQETGPAPDYASKLMVAAAPGGEKFETKLTLVRRGEK